MHLQLHSQLYLQLQNKHEIRQMQISNNKFYAVPFAFNHSQKDVKNSSWWKSSSKMKSRFSTMMKFVAFLHAVRMRKKVSNWWFVIIWFLQNSIAIAKCNCKCKIQNANDLVFKKVYLVFKKVLCQKKRIKIILTMLVKFINSLNFWMN